MIAAVLPEFELSEIDVLFIENVGNLVCPAGYDFGQQHKFAVLSVPEGNDKIPKYPSMFLRTELVLLNKIDLLPYLEFDLDEAVNDLAGINPHSRILPVSAKTNDGLGEWYTWIKEAITICKKR